MKIYSVFDPEFRPYGKVLEDYDTLELTAAMQKIPMPGTGVSYEASIPALEGLPVFRELSDRGFGGMPIQLGMCWGYNTRLNCLEYHRDSEINIGSSAYILLLAKLDEVRDGVLDTALVKAFYAPAGAVVEVYATTLHYAPCFTDGAKGFRVAVVLPRGTNTACPLLHRRTEEDKWLTARNKWLLAHPESAEARQGAHIGLRGENLDILNSI